METENRQLKREIERLKRENAELRQMNDELKRSLEAGRSIRPQPAQRGPRLANSVESEARSESVESSKDSELQRKLSKTTKQLSDVQERLIVLEQVTAATQRRELIQEGLASDSDYEELPLHTLQEHVYATLQLKAHTGCIIDLFIITPDGSQTHSYICCSRW